MGTFSFGLLPETAHERSIKLVRHAPARSSDHLVLVHVPPRPLVLWAIEKAEISVLDAWTENVRW